MSVPFEVASFVQAFYAASDVGPSGHDAYLEYYTKDTTLIMGGVQYDGLEGIMRFRVTGWEKIATRKHVVHGIFPDPSRPEEHVMVYGSVDYGYKDGSKENGVQFGARMDLQKDQGKLKLQFYQVYITRKVVPDTAQ